MCILFGHYFKIFIFFHKMNFIIFSCQSELMQNILCNSSYSLMLFVLKLYCHGLMICIFVGYNLIFFVTFSAKLTKVKIYLVYSTPQTVLPIQVFKS